MPPLSLADDATFAILLTPAGRGAVATILVSGLQATAIVETHFQPASGKPLSATAIGRVVFGRWGGSAGEEIVVARRSDVEIELNCHGGAAAPQALLEALVHSGCQQVAWREWIAATTSDPIVADVRCALADATTQKAAMILLDQLHGALRGAVDRIATEIAAGAQVAAREQVDALLRYAAVGLHLTRPWNVTLAGRPNVGKSSLINALVGFERAIVFDQPGTTRDVVTATTALDGWPVELSDTAGLRVARDPLEAAGIGLARARLAAADLIVFVFDASADSRIDDERLLGELLAAQADNTKQSPERHNAPAVLTVLNKCDLLPRDAPSTALVTSALCGTGIDELAHSIAARLIPDTPPAGAAVPFTCAHVDCLRQVRAALASGDMHTASACLASTFRQRQT